MIAAVLAAMCLTELLVSSDGSGLALGAVEVLLLCAPLLVLRTHPVAGTCVAAVLMLAVRRVDGFPELRRATWSSARWPTRAAPTLRCAAGASRWQR